MAEVTLELVCGRCGEWWIRWAVDPDRPFDEQLLTSAVGEPYLLPEVRQGVMTTESPGSYSRASDAGWYRWVPGKAVSLAEGDTYGRYEFTCPSGCSSDVQTRVRRLDTAAVETLRYLHETRTPVFRTTADKLLQFSS